jgi:hypothetical protein
MYRSASDKCKGESECLSFPENMQMAAHFWDKYLQAHSLPPTDPTIIFTTESTSVVQDQITFVTNATWREKYPYQPRFITNAQDVTPDTGFVSEATRDKSRNITANNALLSSIASLKLQMLARVTVGNCCSNFHALLSDFYAQGCGGARTNDFWCSQENDDISLMVCCGWHHDCQQMKAEYMHNLSLATNATATAR